MTGHKDITKVFIYSQTINGKFYYAWTNSKINIRGIDRLKSSYLKKNGTTNLDADFFNSRRYLFQTLKKYYPNHEIIPFDTFIHITDEYI
jgi:hypothetical protein